MTPIPILAATLGGTIIRAIKYFLLFQAVKTLAAFGLSIGVYVGLDQFVTYAGNQISQALSSVGNVTAFGQAIDAIAMIKATGIIDAINIILSCHLTALTIKSAKVGIFGLSK